MIRAALAGLVVGLGGCTSSGPEPGCGAEAYQSIVGQPLTVAEASLPPGGYKVDYPLPDGTVTVEEFWDRLRISVDAGGIIRSVSCG